MTDIIFKNKDELVSFLGNIFHTDSIDTMYDRMQLLPAGGIALPVSSIIYRNKAVSDLISMFSEEFLFLHVRKYETNIPSEKALDDETLFSEKFEKNALCVIDNSRGASVVYVFYMENGHINDKIMAHLIRWLCLVYMIENKDINDFTLTDAGYIFVRNGRLFANEKLKDKSSSYAYMLAFMHIRALQKGERERNDNKQYIRKI